MEDEWQQEKIPHKDVNKWEGEDEEDDVKESWDIDDDEEKKDEEKVETPVRKPKKTLQQKINERERQKQEEVERKLKEKEEENMSPEEKLAEKLRLQKLAEENDLKLGLESLGLSSGSAIDGRNPKNAEEFSEFADAISKKMLQFKNSDEFPNMVEEIVRNVCATMTSNNIRKIKLTIDNLHLEKQKIEKGDKPKKKGKGGKARLRVEGDNVSTKKGKQIYAKLDEYVTQYDATYDDFDDFM